jgi:hypothetical protein
MGRQQFFSPPGRLLDPAKLSKRKLTSSVTAFNTLATATKGKSKTLKNKNYI